jgi:hypothetical protein
MRGNNRRLLEWSLILVVVLLASGFFVREFRFVQGQGELAAVKTTLGALRTALLLDHLKRAVDGKADTAALQRNPFLLLAPVPANYAGALSSMQGQVPQPGSWVFDAYCHCIGYEPLYPQALATQSDAPAVWFRVSAPPGPLQITAMQSYFWLGQPLE